MSATTTTTKTTTGARTTERTHDHYTTRDHERTTQTSNNTSRRPGGHHGSRLLEDADTAVTPLTWFDDHSFEFHGRIVTAPHTQGAISGARRSDAKNARMPRAVLRFAIREGRNRQIRRMCKSEGLTVEWLLRTRIGPLRLGNLAIGAARDATEEEQKALVSAL
ncbi:SVR1 [Symbiodinium sp. CCMP2456]|nr:SVR1 [Symbiodinium sp. CCMP2456]